MGEGPLEALDLEGDGEIDVAGKEKAELVAAHRDRARVLDTEFGRSAKQRTEREIEDEVSYRWKVTRNEEAEGRDSA